MCVWRSSVTLRLVLFAVATAITCTFATAQQAADWFEIVARGTAIEVEAVLAAGADANTPDENGWTPLAIAAARNPDPGVVYVLARAGAELEREVRTLLTPYRPIHIAARSNPNPSVIRALVDAGADVNSRVSHGATALTLASEWAAWSLTNLTTHYELEVEAAGLEGEVLTLATPLQPDLLLDVVVFYLPDLGFSFEVLLVGIDETRSRLTLQRALPFPPDLEQVFVKVRISSGDEVLEPTTASRYEVLEALIYSGADVNARDNYGHSPLMNAVRQSDGYYLTQLLLEHGASWQARSESGFTALHAAAISKDTDVRTIELLLREGLDVNVSDRRGGTPIIEAVQFGTPDVIGALLDAGAAPRFPVDYQSFFGADIMELARLNQNLYRDGMVVHPIYWRLNDMQYD